MMNFCGFVAVLFCFLQVGDAKASKEKTIIRRLNTGTIKGKIVRTTKGNVGNVFLNIPYAAPPLGDLRFRPAEPIQPWKGVLDCTEYGAACPSTSDYIHKTSEDCLNLNVFAGRNCTKNQPCPVIFYVYGGMWYHGGTQRYSPNTLIDNFASAGLLFITVGYRLGALGLWYTGQPDALGNSAIHDLLEGLRWVKENIRYLGGDPDTVSMMGHSSGAGAISLITLTPKSKNLYRRVIILSGPAFLLDCTEVNKELAVRLHCATNSSWDSGHEFQQISGCMRKIPVKKLMMAQTIMEIEGRMCIAGSPDGPNGLFPFSVNRLREEREPYETLLGDTQSEYGNFMVPYLVSDTSDEGIVQSCAKLTSVMGFKSQKEISEQCPSFFNPLFSNKTEMLKEIGDSAWFVGMYLEGSTMRKKGAPVYLYSFDYVKAGLEGIVPYHSYELNWLIQRIFPVTEDDKKIGAFFLPLFVNFAKFGNPTPWNNVPKFDLLSQPVGFNYYSINLPEPRNLPYFHLPLVQFWTQIAPAIEAVISPSEPLNLQLQAVENDTENPTSAQNNWQTAFYAVLAVGVTFFVVLAVFGAVKARKTYLNRKKMLIGLDMESENYVTFEKSRLIDAAEYNIPDKRNKRRYYFK